MEINGNSLSWSAFIAIIGIAVSYGALQFQVNNNSSSLLRHESQESHPIATKQLVELKTTQDIIKIELKEMKALSQAQTELQNQIVYQLAELNKKLEEE